MKLDKIIFYKKFERNVSGKRKAVVTKTKKYNKNLAILYKNSLAR